MARKIKSEPIPTVELVGDIVETGKIGPYANCGDNNHIRTHINFALALKINGKPLKAELEIQKRENAFGKPINGHAKGWVANIRVNTEAEANFDYECEVCGGNWGVSTPETSGLTAKVISEVVLPAMAKIGYPIDTSEAHAGGFCMFYMQGTKVVDFSTIKFAPTRNLPKYHTEHITYLECPVHGKRAKRELEGDFD